MPFARRGIFSLMLPCALFWGSIFICGKLAVREANPMAVATLRFLIAMAVLVPLLLWREPDALRRLSWRDLPLALGLGLSGVAAYNVLAMWGLNWAPASDGATITPTLNPILTTVGAAWLFGEAVSRRKVIGLGLALFGVVLVAAGGNAVATTGPMRAWGDLLFVGAAVAWSSYSLLGRAAGARFSALMGTAVATTVGTLMLLPVSWQALTAIDWANLSLTFWLSEVVLGVFSTVVAFMLWHEAVTRFGAGRASSFLPLNPVFGVLMAVWLLGETMTGVQMAGMVLAVGGVVLANWTAKAAVTPAVEQPSGA